MKYIALVLLAFVSLALAQQKFAVHQEIIDSVNANPVNKWRAAHNQFSTWSVDSVKKMLGTKLSLQAASRSSGVHPKIVLAGLPDNFDSRVAFKGCVHPIRNQAQCGSCWAFGASESLSDRFCIASNGTVNVILAPQDLVSCDTTDFGCNGGQLSNAWAYMAEHGVVPEACFPYQSQQGNAPTCPSTCVSGKSFSGSKYFAKKYYKVSPTIMFWERVKDIQTEIMAHGPVEAAFSVYQDFMAYKSGVYHHTTGSFLGGHAIKVVGWGVENDGTHYWLVANSWGVTWGEQGFFKILRGKNECGIEAEVYAGLADLSRLPKSA